MHRERRKRLGNDEEGILVFWKQFPFISPLSHHIHCWTLRIQGKPRTELQVTGRSEQLCMAN